MNDAAVNQDQWDYFAKVAEEEKAAAAERERAEAYGKYIAPSGAPKITGLPTNPLDPSTATLPYQQGSFSYKDHWGTPEWYGGQPIGYSFVQHDAQPGYKSVFWTDLEGNVVKHEIQPEGEDLTFKDIVKMSIPFLLNVIPGAGASLGAIFAPTAQVATQAVIGNALISGVMAEANGKNFLEGALAGGIGSYATTTLSPSLAKALGGGTAGDIVSKAIVGGVKSELSGGNFATGALTSATNAGINSVLDRIPQFDGLTNGQQSAIVNLATNAMLSGKLTELDVLNSIFPTVIKTAETGKVPSSKDFESGSLAPGGADYIEMSSGASGGDDDVVSGGEGTDTDVIDDETASSIGGGNIDVGGGSSDSFLDSIVLAPDEEIQGTRIREDGSESAMIKRVNPNDPDEVVYYEAVKDPVTGTVSYEWGGPSFDENGNIIQEGATTISSGSKPSWTWDAERDSSSSTQESEAQTGSQDQAGVKVDEGVRTGQWQTIGDNRIFIHDDGTATVVNPVGGYTDTLDRERVDQLIDAGLLQPALSNLSTPTGDQTTEDDEVVVTAPRGEAEDDEVVITAPRPDPEDNEIIVTAPRPEPEDNEIIVTAPRPEPEDDEVVITAPRLEPDEVIITAPRPEPEDDEIIVTAPRPEPEEEVPEEEKKTSGGGGGGGGGGTTTTPRGVIPTTTSPGTQASPSQKGVLPAGSPFQQPYLNIGMSKDKFIDPLSRLYQIQQATQQGGGGNLSQMMFQQFNPSAYQSNAQDTEDSSLDDSYYNYGESNDPYDANPVDPFSPAPYSPSPYAMGFESQALGAAQGGAIMATPLMARGGKTAPLDVNGVLPTVSQGRENFKQGKHVAGEGDGQSDDIPAWLADGEFVFPADVVSALGNGSTKAGTDKLYAMMHSIREHARSAKPKDLPPPAKKSPLDYLKA